MKYPLVLVLFSPQLHSAVQAKRHVHVPISIRPFKWSDPSPLSTNLCRTLFEGWYCTILCIPQKILIAGAIVSSHILYSHAPYHLARSSSIRELWISQRPLLVS
ncbi:uncharacterized protein HD556DRAFT_615137 [Suillus plorans]|uniref:Uncharacterized protein n=1 Tax=Suillus plorans TaxID=116603 RepID=A0A9P7J5C2_9AGAM|nr:uncharacterized protein HD556DRAFT_615137 [Suillus plorans]KAG1803856.1 hypothetical protein HD556DRAFT_615137 [Suillus plorans]